MNPASAAAAAERSASSVGSTIVEPSAAAVIGSVTVHRPFADGDARRCRIAAHPVNDKRVDFDIALETVDGQPVATLEGVEFYVAGTGS